MRGFIVDTSDDRVVFVGDLKHQEALAAPRYRQVPIESVELEPPIASRRIVKWTERDGFSVEDVVREEPTIDITSPTLAQDLAQALAARGLVTLKE